jgi:hypothetical protein
VEQSWFDIDAELGGTDPDADAAAVATAAATAAGGGGAMEE